MERQAGLGRSLEDVLDSLTPVAPDTSTPGHVLFGLGVDDPATARDSEPTTKKSKENKKNKSKKQSSDEKKKHKNKKNKKKKSKKNKKAKKAG